MCVCECDAPTYAMLIHSIRVARVHATVAHGLMSDKQPRDRSTSAIRSSYTWQTVVSIGLNH